MKRIITIAAALLLTATAIFAQSGKSIYRKYSGTKDVSAVYVSPAMFRIMGRIPDLKIEDEDINLTPIIKSLTGLYIVNSENSDINASLKSDVDKFVSSGKYELLMEAKDDGETVQMYTVGSETIVDSFVMIVVEPDEATFICLDGKMKRSDLEEVLASQMAD